MCELHVERQTGGQKYKILRLSGLMHRLLSLGHCPPPLWLIRELPLLSSIQQLLASYTTLAVYNATLSVTLRGRDVSHTILHTHRAQSSHPPMPIMETKYSQPHVVMHTASSHGQHPGQPSPQAACIGEAQPHIRVHTAQS